jgi:hypothetical protein
MAQEATPTTPQPTEGQEPEGNGGQTPPEPQPTPAPDAQPKVFDEAYVKQLRSEAAATRKQLADVSAKLAEREDADKTDQQRLEERAAESEQRLTAAEAKLIRYEVVAQHGLPLDAADKLAGTTREEVEANAEWLKSQLPTQQPPPSFDGGARATPEATKAPGDAHNDFLLNVLRGGQQQ